jgi:hypothetical protein
MSCPGERPRRFRQVGPHSVSSRQACPLSPSHNAQAFGSPLDTELPSRVNSRTSSSPGSVPLSGHRSKYALSAGMASMTEMRRKPVIIVPEEGNTAR